MDTQPNENPNVAKAHGILRQIEEFFFGLYKKVPFHLPANVREVIVKVGPILLLIALLLTIPAILTVLGINSYMAKYSEMYGVHTNNLLFYSAFWIIGIILEALALPGLFKRSIKGWHFLFYATLVNSVHQLINMEIIGLVIGLALSLYILFEVKEYYK